MLPPTTHQPFIFTAEPHMQRCAPIPSSTRAFSLPTCGSAQSSTPSPWPTRPCCSPPTASTARTTSAIKFYESTSWYALAGATALALLSAAVVVACMNPERRHTFYKPKTAREYIDEWHWETRTVARIGTGQEAARAHTCTSFVPRCLPEAKVKAWLAANWTAWVEDPPVWFDEKWRRKVGKNFPSEWFPEAARVQLEAERVERAARRASSRRSTSRRLRSRGLR